MIIKIKCFHDGNEVIILTERKLLHNVENRNESKAMERLDGQKMVQEELEGNVGEKGPSLVSERGKVISELAKDFLGVKFSVVGRVEQVRFLLLKGFMRLLGPWRME